MKLELYMKPTCPYCRRVMAAIDEMGIGSKIEVHDILADPDAHRRVVEEGGIDQVPCLFVDGKPMYESADIIAWLKANC